MTWPVRIVVSSPGFHPGHRSSILLPVTSFLFTPEVKTPQSCGIEDISCAQGTKSWGVAKRLPASSLTTCERSNGTEGVTPEEALCDYRGSRFGQGIPSRQELTDSKNRPTIAVMAWIRKTTTRWKDEAAKSIKRLGDRALFAPDIRVASKSGLTSTGECYA